MHATSLGYHPFTQPTPPTRCGHLVYFIGTKEMRSFLAVGIMKIIAFKVVVKKTFILLFMSGECGLLMFGGHGVLDALCCSRET